MATAASAETANLPVETAQVPLARGFAELPASGKLGLMIGIAALAAILVAAVLWARTPEYRVLFSNLSDRDGGAIVTALSQMNVPYKFAEGGGAILVPAAQVHDARLRLASQGLPKGGTVGFEVLESQKFGATQFQEQVNYQRALEGELARSIQSLGQVQSARVHLAIPKPSVFLRDQQKPTASVLLSLHPAKNLERNQVAGIVHLVASSVPELNPKNVSIVDQNGALLSGSGDGQDMRLDPSQLAYVREVESQLTKRIGEILDPVLGRANFRAQVTAELDFTQMESTDERYKPNANPAEATIRSTQTSDAASAATGPGAQGIPGALTNQPPGPTAAPIQGNAAKAATPDAGVRNPSSTQRNAVTNYEVDKTIRHIRSPTGSIKRLSSAVVINHRKAEGAEKPVPIADEELATITALVKEAMGFREDRGDTLKVSSAPFNPDITEPPVEVPIWRNPEYVHLAIEAAKYLFVVALFLYLVLGVLKPTLRQLATPRITLQTGAPTSLPAARAQAAEGGSPHAGAMPGEEDEEDLLPLPNQTSDPRAIARALRGPDKQINAREIAKADPKLVANVVRTWVTKSE